MATSITNTSITTDDLVVDSADNLLKVDHATNRVGIGTITPDTVFHVNAVDPPGSVMAKFVSNGNPWIQRVGSGGSWQTGVTTNGYEFYNDTNSQYNVVISPTGNVGIGTRSPARQLSIVDDGTNGQAIMELIDSTNNNLAGIFLGRANNTNIGGIRYFHSTNHLALRSNDVDALIIDSSGNVGIGTEDPSENLEIKTSGPALKLTDTANSNNNIKISQGYNSYLTASNNIYMSASGHSDMLNLINGAVQVKKTRTGTISGGASDTGAVIKLHTEAQWESGYGNNALATTNDYLGGIEFHTGDGSTGEGLRAAVRGTVDSYYNQNSIVFETADGATAADPIERMRVWHNGIVTKPYHPAFGAVGFPSHRYMNTWHGVDLDDWNFVYQRNTSHYNNSNGRFTAPVAGMYHFYYHSMFTNPSTNDYHVQIKINGTPLTYSNEHSGGGSGNGHQWNGASVELTVNLNAGDYATCASVANSSSTCYLYGSSTSSRYSSWGGYLLG
jgi:hypothetical protein